MVVEIYIEILLAENILREKNKIICNQIVYRRFIKTGTITAMMISLTND